MYGSSASTPCIRAIKTASMGGYHNNAVNCVTQWELAGDTVPSVQLTRQRESKINFVLFYIADFRRANHAWRAPQLIRHSHP